jgi:hypothetical protein
MPLTLYIVNIDILYITVYYFTLLQLYIFTDAIQTIEPVVEPAMRRVSSRKGKGVKK